MNDSTGYRVRDSHTGATVRVFDRHADWRKNARAAHRCADRLDAEYGAVRYVVERA